ncbi:hypothetical protein KXV64_007778 [Aspergillus fumigatus]|nr:hypothetical protein KXV64_007778 [Aspergillus fumigatus]
MTSQTKNTASIEHSEEKEDPAEASSLTATAGSFGRWVLTPMGFAITVYGLNLIAWGGMLFLLLCNAAPAMCHPSCNDLYSSRRIWIEIDSQILNALFCVTGFGLAPWRIRDLYLWCRWRLGREAGTRRKWFDRLAEVHASWFYQRPDPNGTSLLTTTPDSPSEGRGATPTPRYKLHVVIWGNILNTGFQICLAACSHLQKLSLSLNLESSNAGRLQAGYPVVSTVKAVTYILADFTNLSDLFASVSASASPTVDLDDGWSPSFTGTMYYRRLGGARMEQDITVHELRVRMIAINLKDPACGSGSATLASSLALQDGKENGRCRFNFDQGSEIGQQSYIAVEYL